MRRPSPTSITATLFGVAMLMCPCAAQTPELAWARQVGGFDADMSEGIAVDSGGNVYTTGRFWGSVDFDPGPAVFDLTSAGSTDAFVCKLDGAGNFVWAKNMGGILGDGGNDVAVDDSGNVIVTGSFQNSADFGTAVALDGTGAVHSTGSFRGTVDFDPGPGVFDLAVGTTDIFVSKLDAAGDFVWAGQMGGSVGEASRDIAVDGSGNVYVTGSFEGSSDFDPGAGTFNLSSLGSDDVFLSKLSRSGAMTWVRQIGGTGTDRADGLALDAAGNPHVTGSFTGTADFDPGIGTVNLTSLGDEDVFVAKLDAAGTLDWVSRLGGAGVDLASAIDVDATGNVASTGFFLGNADFDPGPGTFDLTASAGFSAYVSKLDASGDFVWAGEMGGSGLDIGRDVAAGGSGDVYTTGIFTGLPDLDPGAGVASFTSNGADDVFIVRLDDPTWVDLENGLAGTHGIPSLTGTGTLVGGTPVTLTLSGAVENSTSFLVVGLAPLFAPFNGGVLVPDPVPPGFVLVLPTNAGGGFVLPAVWPLGSPSGFTIYLQGWIQDPAGPLGFAASNAISGTTP